MSALGQKQTFKRLRLMPALPPKADIDQSSCDVRQVPKADIEHFEVRRITMPPVQTPTRTKVSIYREPRLARRLRNAESPVCFLI